MCTGGHAVTLEGIEAKRAAEYLPKFCADYASAAAADIKSRTEILGAADAAALGEGTPPLEKVWVNDLLRTLPWRTCASRRVMETSTSMCASFGPHCDMPFTPPAAIAGSGF